MTANTLLKIYFLAVNLILKIVVSLRIASTQAALTHTLNISVTDVRYVSTKAGCLGTTAGIKIALLLRLVYLRVGVT